MPKPSRKKNTVAGSAGGVYRRDDISLGLGGPVGRKDGYIGSSHSHHTTSYQHSSGSHSGGYSGGSDINRAGGVDYISLIFALLKKSKLARIIALVLVVMLVLSMIRGGACSSLDFSNPGYSSGIVTGGGGSADGLAGAVAATHEADTTVASGARSKRTVIKGNNDDVFTIMVYMCGADLESRSGMATSDLKEMIEAKTNDKINLIVETGGASKWQNTTVSNSTNQIYRVTHNGMTKLTDIGKKPMTDPATLAEFIKYASTNFPANRYGLIFWDHGGGSVTGYGYDELYPNTSMTLDEIDSALAAGGVNFDFIGYDACLMATLENALVCERYADYLIASEETEPGVGWYYTNWLTQLANNTSMPTVELGKNIVDGFIDRCAQATPGAQTTLSVTDLAELSGTVPASLTSFSQKTCEMVKSDSFEQVSNARSTSKEFQKGLNQVDLIDLATKMGTPEGAQLASALKSAIKYNRTSRNVSNANGLTIFFPYGSAKNMKSALSTFDKIKLDNAYCDCIKSFASMSGGGQVATGLGGSLTDSLFGGGSSGGGDSLGSLISLLGGGGGGSSGGLDSADLVSTALQLFLSNRSTSAQTTGIDVGQADDWFDTGLVTNQAGYFAEHRIDPAKLVPTQTDSGYILDLDPEEWELVDDILLNVFVDDGTGYIDLGLDNVYELNASKDLKLDYDNTWLTINGQVIAYYMDSYEYNAMNDYVIMGHSPIMLNGNLCELVIMFDNADPDGKVLGAREIYTQGETETIPKGLIEIKDGDVIDFICDYYSYDQTYDDSYLLGERMTVNGELTLANMDIGSAPKKVTYCLTDIYGNELWVDSLDF